MSQTNSADTTRSIPSWSSVSEGGQSNVSHDESTSTHAPKNSSEKKKNQAVIGAAIVGSVVGLAVVGPIVAVAAGATAAVVAATNSGPAGSIARASGDAVMATGRAVKKIDEKHHIVEKTKSLFRKTKDTAQKIDEKHHIVEKTKIAASTVVKKAQEFENQHHVIEKTAHGISNIASKIDPNNK